MRITHNLFKHKGIEWKSKLTILVLAGVSLAIVGCETLDSGQPVTVSLGAPAATGLSGQWFHDGKPTYISVSHGGNVTVTNEHGHTSSGHMSGNDIVIPSLGIHGLVSHGGQRISWSNGTEWRR